MKTLLTSLLLSLTPFSYSQQPIDVTEQTIKIGGMKEELLYFGFAEGDQIVFNFTEIDGKELKEIDISEYPSTSKYADFKTARIENKTLTVTSKGIYQFRFSNGAVGGRICKIRIQRIPANDQAKAFNTNVNWVKKQDTTWNTYTKDVIAAYDTTYRQVTKKELSKTEKKEVFLLEKTELVHTELNSAGNKRSVFFTLPAPESGTYKTSKVVAWAYWVGVGTDGTNAWEQNTANISGLAKGIAATFTTPLGAMAIGLITSLVIPKGGDNVYYAVTDLANKELFAAGYAYQAWDHGDGPAGYKQFVDASMCRGAYYILLSNDNYMDAIEVNVKIIAIIETNTYEDKTYTEQVVTPRYEKKIVSDPVITTRRMPVIGN